MATKSSIRTAASQAWTGDYLQYSGFPDSAGTLFGGWCRAYNASTSVPFARGNFYTLGVRGTNWSVIWLIDNMTIDSSHVVTRYNANTMVFGNATFTAWAGDYCNYIDNTGDLPEADSLGWKWVGHQIILGSSSITMRQWVKFGLSGTPIKTGDETVTFTALRTGLVNNAGWTQGEADAWTPSSLSAFQFGQAGTDSLENAGDIVYTKSIAMSTEPSLSTLDDMALNFAADTSLWGDWTHEWSSGAVVTDRSGNSRSLSSAGGTLYQGAAFDDGEIVCYGTPSAQLSGSPLIGDPVTADFALVSYTAPSNTSVNFALTEIGGNTAITCAGTPSAEASGQPSISSAISCIGTATTEASGQPAIAIAGATITCAGTPSAEASGSPVIGAGITTAGTATTATSGSPSIGLSINCTGTASAEASGSPSIATSITCTGTASSEASGQPTISVGGGTISCQGTPSSEASGSPGISVSISCSGTGSGESSGAPSIGVDITAIGTPTTAANGSPDISARITTSGTASTAASGNPLVSVSINAAGTPSSEVSGSPSIGADITTTGTASSEASGHPTIYIGGFGQVVAGGAWQKAMEAEVIIGGQWRTIEKAYAVIASEWTELS